MIMVVGEPNSEISWHTDRFLIFCFPVYTGGLGDGVRTVSEISGRGAFSNENSIIDVCGNVCLFIHWFMSHVSSVTDTACVACVLPYACTSCVYVCACACGAFVQSTSYASARVSISDAYDIDWAHTPHTHAHT